MFDNFNVNLCKNQGFLTYIPYIPIPEYGKSNAPIVSSFVSQYSLTIEIRSVMLLH